MGKRVVGDFFKIFEHLVIFGHMGEMESPHMGKRGVGDFLFLNLLGGELNPGIWQKGGPTDGGKGAHSLNFFGG